MSTTMQETKVDGESAALSGLSLDQLVREINDEHRNAEQAMRDGIEHAHRAGELLLHVKDKLMHGAFMPWVERYCEFSHRTATMYMRIASGWDRITADWQSVANLGIGALDRWLTDDAETDDKTGLAPDAETEGEIDPSLDEEIDALFLEMVRSAEGVTYASARLAELGHAVPDVAQTAAALAERIRAEEAKWKAVRATPRPEFTPASARVPRERLVRHLKWIAIAGPKPGGQIDQAVFNGAFDTTPITPDMFLLVIAPRLEGVEDLGQEVGVPDLWRLIRSLDAGGTYVTVRLEGHDLVVDGGGNGGVLRFPTCAPKTIATRVASETVKALRAQVDGCESVVLPPALQRSMCTAYARLKAEAVWLTVGPDGTAIRIGDKDADSAEFSLAALKRPAGFSTRFGGHVIAVLRALSDCPGPVTLRVVGHEKMIAVEAAGYQYLISPVISATPTLEAAKAKLFAAPTAP